MQKLGAARGGSPLLEVFSAQRARLIGLAARIIGCRSHAEDIVHDAFMKVENAAQGEEIQSQASYLNRVVRNLSIDHYRRRQFEEQLINQDADCDESPALAGDSPVLVSFQLPMFDELLPHAEWGGLLEAFWWICYAIREFWFVLAALIAGGIAWFVWSFRNWCSPLRYRMDSHLPYSLYRDLSAAGFLNAMAEYMVNKTPMITALEDLEERSSPWMAERIGFTLNWLDERPGEYAEAFNNGLLSPEIHLRLVAYAERGNARVSGANDAFAMGLVQLGTDGMNHVTDRVEKSSGYVTFVSAIAVVVILFVFYGGFNTVANMVSDHYENEADAVGTQ